MQKENKQPKQKSFRIQGQKYKIYENPVNNHRVEVKEGFNFPVLFFGVLWFLFKGMIAKALFWFFIALITFGIGWFIAPFVANKQYEEYLLEKGYKFQGYSKKT